MDRLVLYKHHSLITSQSHFNVEFPFPGLGMEAPTCDDKGSARPYIKFPLITKLNYEVGVC